MMMMMMTMNLKQQDGSARHISLYAQDDTNTGQTLIMYEGPQTAEAYTDDSRLVSHNWRTHQCEVQVIAVGACSRLIKYDPSSPARTFLSVDSNVTPVQRHTGCSSPFNSLQPSGCYMNRQL